MFIKRVHNYLVSHLNSLWYRIKFIILGKKIKIGRNFRVRGRLSIKGPGSVIIGDNVLIDGRGVTVTPYTYSPDAVIKIGDNSFINGARFGCVEKIDIGPYAILGDARIMDTDFHSIEINRHEKGAKVLHSPIIIEKNVWIASGAVILKGVKIGENSVIGFNAVVTGDIESNCIAAGNPARVVKQL